MPTTYALGNWTVSTKQDKGVKRLFNKANTDLIRAAISAGTIINSGGTGYAIGNVLTLVDSGTTTTAATFNVTSVGANGAVTGVVLSGDVSTPPSPNAGGNYTTHQGANNHATTVSPAGGSGCVLAINFYTDVPNMVVRNGGILDNAVTSYAAQQDQEIQAAINAAVQTANDTQLANAASAFGIVLPA